MERFRIFTTSFFWTLPLRMHLRRVKRGQYLFEQLFYGFTTTRQFYILAWTIRLGLRNSSCSLDAKYISRDEAGEWMRDRFGVDDSVALLEQEAAAHERERHWFE